jgi:tripartite-type tricarboxylate transporter receptor subunit TctC
MEDFPDVPTMKEAGADVDAVLRSRVFLPRDTPPAIVKKLEGEFMRIAKLSDVIARLKLLAPSKPCSRNRRAAASTIRSRFSAAFSRFTRM